MISEIIFVNSVRPTELIFIVLTFYHVTCAHISKMVNRKFITMQEVLINKKRYLIEANDIYRPSPFNDNAYKPDKNKEHDFPHNTSSTLIKANQINIQIMPFYFKNCFYMQLTLRKFYASVIKHVYIYFLHFFCNLKAFFYSTRQ